MKLVVYPFDRETGEASRGGSVESTNTVPFTYDWPTIDQFVVEEHPTSKNQLVIKLIGKNFGSIEKGRYPDVSLPMQVLNVPPGCSQANEFVQWLEGAHKTTPPSELIDCPAESEAPIEMRLGGEDSKWSQRYICPKMGEGAQDERYDEVVLYGNLIPL